MATHFGVVGFVNGGPLFLLPPANLFFRFVSRFRTQSLLLFRQVTVPFLYLLRLQHSLFTEGEKVIRVLPLLFLIDPSDVASAKKSIYLYPLVVQRVQIIAGSIISFLPIELKYAREFLRRLDDFPFLFSYESIMNMCKMI